MATSKRTIKTVRKAVVPARKPKLTERGFRPQIRSRHPSHSPLRTSLTRLPFRTIIRFGSTTEIEDTIDNGGGRVECNTTNAIKNSSSKLRMKSCFAEAKVRTATWYTTRKEGEVFQFGQNGEFSKITLSTKLEYPIVAKTLFGSRGEGNTLLKTEKDLLKFLPGKTLGNYIFEKFYNYNREYRLHVTEDGCFYTCRKMLREGTPTDKKWFRNDSNSVWIREENEQFDRPINWDTIVVECVKSLKAVGLDFGAVDLRVQSAKDEKEKVRKDPDFIVIEINSAPSFGEVTLSKYQELLPALLTKKFKQKKSK